MKLINYNNTRGFHFFSMEGNKSTYNLTIINVPNGFEGYGWGDKHYIVINEDATISNMTKSKTNNCYKFTKHYFSGENINYLPNRIGIPKSNWDDFMNCVTKYVYPKI